MTCVSEPGLMQALATIRDNPVAERFHYGPYGKVPERNGRALDCSRTSGNQFPT